MNRTRIAASEKRTRANLKAAILLAFLVFSTSCIGAYLHAAATLAK